MVQQLQDFLLHKHTRHTNKYMPYSNFVKGDIFPEQIKELLNTTVTIKYRNYNLPESCIKYREPISRPHDDMEFKPRVAGAEETEDKFFYEGKFRVLRADAAEPYTLIAVSEDYSMMIVNSTKEIDGKYEFEDKVSEYPLQMNEFVGLLVWDQYAAEIRELKAVTLRVDRSEPCYSIMMEFLGSSGEVRFIIGDEAFSKIYEYYKEFEDRDYDGKTSSEVKDIIPVDVEGWFAEEKAGATYKDINSGYADNFAKMYTDDVLSDKGIIELRKEVLKEIKIYGAN